MKDISGMPPYSNRGAQNTWSKSLTACVDWLQVTFKTIQNPYDVIDLLGLEHTDFTSFETGKYGFSFHLRYGHIAIYFGENFDFVHLEMTGQGCREYEEYKKHDWSVFIGMILLLDVNITRLDLAIDDKKGYFSFSTIKKKIKEEQVRSKFKSARILEEFQLSDGQTLGTTVYFGSPQSMIQVRMYDKLKEKLKKGQPVDEGLKKWIRTEIQLRDERAYIAAKIISENQDADLGSHIAGILKRYITFVDRSSDSNKSRWPISKFWDKFLGDVQELPLTLIAPDSSIQKTETWIDKSVVASLDTLLEAHDYNPNFIVSLIQEGGKKRKKKHENMLARFRKERGLSQDGNTEIRNKLIKTLSLMDQEIKKDLHLDYSQDIDPNPNN